MPRLVVHIDDHAIAAVGQVFKEVIPPDAVVLDLMSSVHSNLLDGQMMGACYGLGLNAQEMKKNPVLSGAVVADLNSELDIPFVNGIFDAAICTVSIDYLVDPIRTVSEVARLLRPNAAFAVTFSNRWFPPKVTRLWTLSC